MADFTGEYASILEYTVRYRPSGSATLLAAAILCVIANWRDAIFLIYTHSINRHSARRSIPDRMARWPGTGCPF